MRQRRKKDSNKNVEKQRGKGLLLNMIQNNWTHRTQPGGRICQWFPTSLEVLQGATDQEEGPYLECNQKGNRLIILEVYLLEH